MARVIQWIEKISLWSGRISAWLTLVGVLILSYEVFGRYFFRYSWVLAHEVTTKTLGVMYVVAGAYALLHGDHVGVDVLSSRLGPRARAALEVVTSSLFFLFVGGLLIHGWDFFHDAFARREHSLENPGMPTYPYKFAIPLGVALLLLQGVANLLRNIGILLGKGWASTEGGSVPPGGADAPAAHPGAGEPVQS